MDTPKESAKQKEALIAYGNNTSQKTNLFFPFIRQGKNKIQNYILCHVSYIASANFGYFKYIIENHVKDKCKNYRSIIFFINSKT